MTHRLPPTMVRLLLRRMRWWVMNCSSLYGMLARSSRGAMDPCAIKYAAFYGDCPHEVLPVKSGYRLCLTYNLVTVVDDANAAASEPTFGQNHALYASLKTALCEFFTDTVADEKPKSAKRGSKKKKPKTTPHQPKMPFDLKDPLTHRATKLVYVLSHKYTESSLAPAFLKNKDALVASSLSQFCRESDGMFELYLCKLKYHFEWRGEPESMYRGGDDDLGEHDSLKKSVSLGTEWVRCGSSAATTPESIQVAGKDPKYEWLDRFGDVFVDWASEVAPCQFFDDDKLVFDRQNESMYTGNEGSLLEKWYSSAALVVVPVVQRVIAQAYSAPLATWASVWLPMVDSNPTLAKAVAMTLGNAPTDWSLETPEGKSVVEGLVRLKDMETATAVLKSCKYIDFQPALRHVALLFSWEQVAKMVTDVVVVLRTQWKKQVNRPAEVRGAYAASAISLITSILRADEDDPAVITSLLKASKLTDTTLPFAESMRSLELPSVDAYARLLRLALRISPEQFHFHLLETESPDAIGAMFSDVISPAVRQVLDGHVPDAVRAAVVKLRDGLVVASAAAFQEPYDRLSMTCPFNRSNRIYSYSYSSGPCSTCNTLGVFLKAKDERAIVVTKGYLADHKLVDKLTATTSPEDSTKIVVTKSFEDPKFIRIRDEIAALEKLLAPAVGAA